MKVKCPKGCEPIEVEVHSFIRGDQEENLRDQILVGELNLIQCGECKTVYHAEATVVYLDPTADLLAFIFPASFEGEAEKWKEKMREDHEAMRSGLGEDMPAIEEPEAFFGLEAIRAELQKDDDLEDEAMVAEHVCKEVGLSVFKVARGFARRRGLPRIVPATKGDRFSRERALEGVAKLLEANDRLVSFKGWTTHFEGGGEVPPLLG